MPAHRLPVSAALLCGAALLSATAGPARAQAALVSDLWRVAAGTLVEPPALAGGAVAPLWTPAVVLPAGRGSLRVGVEMIHAPEEVGVNGSTVAVTGRVRGLGTAHVLYGRIGLDDLVRTETSPEALPGSIPAYAEVLSVGMAREVRPGLVAGVATRLLNGRLADRQHSQLGLDFGLIYARQRVRLGATTRFWDPRLGAGEQAASYAAAAEWTSHDFAAWGTEVRLALRYGATATHGERLQHLVSGGLTMGRDVTLDLGGAREASGGAPEWSSRAALGIAAGRYRVEVGRDGGVNGFGATYRFSLSAGFR